MATPEHDLVLVRQLQESLSRQLAETHSILYEDVLTAVLFCLDYIGERLEMQDKMDKQSQAAALAYNRRLREVK
jgi:hypothetical protein